MTTSSVQKRVKTDCGFDIWVIPLPDAVRFRVFFKDEEVGLGYLNDRISPRGLKQLKEIL